MTPRSGLFASILLLDYNDPAEVERSRENTLNCRQCKCFFARQFIY